MMTSVTMTGTGSFTNANPVTYICQHLIITPLCYTDVILAEMQTHIVMRFLTMHQM